MGQKEWDSMMASMEANEEFDRRQDELAENLPERRTTVRIRADIFRVVSDVTEASLDVQIKAAEQLRDGLEELIASMKAEEHRCRYY